MVVAHEVPYAGHGAAYGTAHVFAEDGRLLASCCQQSVVRGSGPDAASPVAGSADRGAG